MIRPMLAHVRRGMSTGLYVLKRCMRGIHWRGVWCPLSALAHLKFPSLT